MAKIKLTSSNILSYSVHYKNDTPSSGLSLSYLFNKILEYKDRYIHTDNDGDYFIEVCGDAIFIYFEESDSWADWISNFDFLATTYKNAEEPWKCHSGFFRVWKTMKSTIEKTVEDILVARNTLNNIDSDHNERISKIVCVGYSHGAALCGLCVEDMVYLFKDKYDINVIGYGFGCPKFTHSKLPKSVEERFKSFYPIRNGNDLVTYVPPTLFGYSHGNKDILVIKPTKRYNCIDAHRPEAYTSELENLCK